MKVLLDTATILIFAARPDSLSPLVRTVVADESNELFVSAVSAWEISTKCSIGKLSISVDVATFFDRLIDGMRCEPIGLDLEDSFLEQGLPPVHRDPFDRMLICQAMARQLVIASPDRMIRQYSVPTIW